MQQETEIESKWEAQLLERLREPGIPEAIVAKLDHRHTRMSCYFHSCGTPACLAGHMAVMPEFSDLLQVHTGTVATVVRPKVPVQLALTRMVLSSKLFSASGASRSLESIRNDANKFFFELRKARPESRDLCLDFLTAVYRISYVCCEDESNAQNRFNELVQVKLNQLEGLN